VVQIRAAFRNSGVARQAELVRLALTINLPVDPAPPGQGRRSTVLLNEMAERDGEWRRFCATVATAARRHYKRAFFPHPSGGAMTTAPRPLIAGNWKMNGSRDMVRDLTGGLVASLRAHQTRGGAVAGAERPLRCEVLVCPPSVLVAEVAAATAGSALLLGAQDCHPDASGAHTGDVSAEMLADLGCRYVIVGHSERRTDHGETDAQVRAKAEAAHRAGLVAIVCIGETDAERSAGRAIEVVDRQLAASVPDGATALNTVVAYEPVWAIGSGKTPTIAEIGEVHDALRERLVGRFGSDGRVFRLLYGGSMKPGNAVEILAVANVDGGLIGGASLKAETFWPIVEACA
jgi:triosephosphate isomerase